MAVFTVNQLRPMADLLIVTDQRLLQADKAKLSTQTDFIRSLPVAAISQLSFTWTDTVELALTDGTTSKWGTVHSSDKPAVQAAVAGDVVAASGDPQPNPSRPARRPDETTPRSDATGRVANEMPSPQAPQAAQSPTAEPAPVVNAVGEPSQPAGAQSEKITSFNAKKVATRLQSENRELVAELTRLRAHLAEAGVLDAADREARIEHLHKVEAGLSGTVERLRHEKSQLDQDIIVSRDRLVLEELGIFDYEHPAESSASLATELESLRSEIRQTNKIGQAITAASGFTFNNSASKGRTFVNQMSRIMLRAYNAEAENAVKTVKAGNLASAQKRLSTAREQIAKQGTMIQLAVTERYHRLRLRELELAARHLQAVAAEKELERERRAELREQKALEAEIKKAKERLEKERTHYLNSIQRLRDAGDEEAAAALQVELDRIDSEIADADYRAANIRAGYVYVISNIGAFGEGVVKIGMTRRLDPMDRVRELGDASVPFTFDVHALFFSDDAVGIEAMLHRDFAAQRLNRVNMRKEFFRVTPQAVLDALQQHDVAVLEFNTHAAAEDFRTSWPT